ncbi:unnamed protein product [Medioppia subpectinata]|uniref:Transcriptional regulator ATRX homolog n=1 Tax=Medioppia subpectinata TaxID=1979941 RepID=A0A7R9PZ28_9ACAR|nr:unnamed protein product [Medioppia subpectinata]CAG2106633.1 unnamed protein product [Medioppia subpectinata]
MRRRRQLSDDEEYGTNDKHETSESSSEAESSDGMDPSAHDSDSEYASDENVKKKSSKQKAKKGKGKAKRKRVKINDSSDDDDCQVLSDENDSPNKSRKHIKKIISDKKLKQQTKDAAEAERERMKRIKEKQLEYNDLMKDRTLKSTDVKELILEFDKDTKEVLVEVDHTLVKFLKPHQTDGIQFMYNCLIETVDQVEGSEGSGAILAHSMGLGKTLQVITFLYTIMTHKDIKKHIKRSLVICPVNTIKNWANEFNIWLNDNDLDDLLVFEMFDAKTPYQRAELLNIWYKRGGVMIIGLTLYSNLVMGRGKKPPKSVRDSIHKTLVDPGPDVVVCDEGHLLKNEKTAYNKAVSQLKCLRRVVLTGTPLQNNLIEYHVMVSFVKPSLLGTKKEFINRFVSPITNGQHEDSTDYDVKIMKKRVHILHTLLNGCVHRKDYNVLVPYLPPKLEFVLSVCLTEKQIELYSQYLETQTDKQRMSLLADYGVLRLVWNHPILLFEQHRRRLEKQEAMDEFINDDEDVDTPVSGDSDIECLDGKAGPSNPPKRRMRTRFGDKDESEEEVKEESNSSDGYSDAWFAKILKKDESKRIELSGKFILLFSILEECEKLGDKILLFSQSLDTLDLVEEMLRIRSQKAEEETDKIPEIDLETNCATDATNIWVKNRDYFRLDGSTASDYRKAWIDLFNEENNYRARLFLLSTKAGGLGINLVGANRCIIFDASWNPSHDVQAIFRVFRFGQKKPVYVYRFVAQGSMEEKIYERQIIKQSLSCRVVDEQSIQRHFKASEMSELYVFAPDTSKDRPTPKVPKDRLLAELLIKHKDYIVKYHEHDSLLENRPEEEMTEEEKQSAWNEYEQEKDQLFLREQQERDQRLQRENYLAQMQQQNQQQQQQQNLFQSPLYQQQMAQLFQTYGQNQFSQQIYQNIMKQQELVRKQQQQRYNEQRAQELARQAAAAAARPAVPAGGLPGYDVMTVEDLCKYLKTTNPTISSSDLIQRTFSVIENGLTMCNKELTSVKEAMRQQQQNSIELRPKYEKLAKEVYNLNLQKTRAQTIFTVGPTGRAAPSILRNNLQSQYMTNTVLLPSTSNTKPTSVLIEEVD